MFCVDDAIIPKFEHIIKQSSSTTQDLSIKLNRANALLFAIREYISL